MRRLLMLLVVVGAACGGEDTSLKAADRPAPDPPRYEASAMVLESREHGPQLCLGGVAESYPPQCGGPDLVGWDWSAVDDEEAATGTRWGTYHVVGTWDGKRLTLTEPPGPARPDQGPPEEEFSTPCDPPPDGWAVVDSATATDEGLSAAQSYAQSQPDYAGSWVDQSINPAADDEPLDEWAMNDPTKLILNLRFTGDLDRHRAEVRSRFGGPLCVTEGRRPLADLRAIQQELTHELEGALSTSVDEVRSVVEVTVEVADEELQASLDDRYGRGVVEITGALEPVR